MTAERIPILMYHRVGEANNDWERKYCVSPARFARHLHALAETGWRAVALTSFFAWLDGSTTLPEKSYVLTFDDGFLGVYDHAAPVLTALRWPSTVFLVTGLLGKRDEWSAAENPAGATYPLMDARHIHELRAQGFSFQSHTRTHPDLRALDDATLLDQLAGARSDLQDLIGEEVDSLAYPYGRYDERVLRAAEQAGYRAAFSVQPGFNRRGVDRYRLRRLDVFGTDSPAALRRKITLGSNDGSPAKVVAYAASRILARVDSWRKPPK